MRDCWTHVLRSYWRHAISSWLTVFLAGMGCLYGCMAAVILSKAPEVGVQMILWSSPILSICLWVHVREQIAVARRALLPGAMTPVLLIFLLLAALSVFVCPAVMAVRDGLSVSGLMAFAMFFFAVAGWWALSGWWPWMLAGQVVWMGLVFGSRTAPVLDFITGRDELAATTLFTLALGAVAFGLVRMCRLNEESSTYYRGVMDVRFSSLRPRMTGQTQQAWQAQKAMGGFVWSAKSMTIPAGGSFVARVRAWSRLGRGAVYFHAFMATSVLLTQWLMFHFEPAAGAVSETILFVWIMLMPSLMTVAGWLPMWTYLEVDSLRPIRRNEFLAEMAGAIAVCCLQAWMVYAGAIVLYYSLFTASLPRLDLIERLASSLAAQVFVYSSCVWLMRYRAMGWLMVAYVPMLVAVTADWNWPVAAIAGVFAAMAAAAVWIFRDARRRWLVTELG